MDQRYIFFSFTGNEEFYEIVGLGKLLKTNDRSNTTGEIRLGYGSPEHLNYQPPKKMIFESNIENLPISFKESIPTPSMGYIEWLQSIDYYWWFDTSVQVVGMVVQSYYGHPYNYPY